MKEVISLGGDIPRDIITSPPADKGGDIPRDITPPQQMEEVIFRMISPLPPADEGSDIPRDITPPSR